MWGTGRSRGAAGLGGLGQRVDRWRLRLRGGPPARAAEAVVSMVVDRTKASDFILYWTRTSHAVPVAGHGSAMVQFDSNRDGLPVIDRTQVGAFHTGSLPCVRSLSPCGGPRLQSESENEVPRVDRGPCSGGSPSITPW